MVKMFKAFTLVEVMVAMFIMAIVAAATVPIISKAKPRIEQTTLRGQYACWQQAGGGYCEAYYDERNLRRVECGQNLKCNFRLDHRPAQFYIIATGAGSEHYHGQTITTYSTTKSNDLNVLFSEGINGATSVQSESNYEIVAKNAVELLNENNVPYRSIDPDNVETCRLQSAGSACLNEHSLTQESCHITFDGTENKNASVNIGGCEKQDSTGNSDNTNKVPLEDCVLETTNTTAGALGNTKYYNCKYDTSEYRVGLVFKDSTKEDQLASLDIDSQQYSPFAKYVNMIPPVRRTEIVECFAGSAAHPDEKEKEYKIGDVTCNFPNGPGAKAEGAIHPSGLGAVLILW